MDFNKIVRDEVPRIIIEHGRKAVVKQVIDIVAIDYLVKKLYEEADEVQAAITSKRNINSHNDISELVNELGDVLEVVRSIAKKNGISIDAVENARYRKAESNGVFDKNYILVSLEGEKF